MMSSEAMTAPQYELAGKEARLYNKVLKRIDDGIRPLTQRQMLMSGQLVKVEVPELAKMKDDELAHVVEHTTWRLFQLNRELVVLPPDPKEPKKRYVTVRKI